MKKGTTSLVHQHKSSENLSKYTERKSEPTIPTSDIEEELTEPQEHQEVERQDDGSQHLKSVVYSVENEGQLVESDNMEGEGEGEDEASEDESSVESNPYEDKHFYDKSDDSGILQEDEYHRKNSDEIEDYGDDVDALLESYENNQMIPTSKQKKGASNLSQMLGNNSNL